jgi:hypothetical protein
VGLRQPDVGEQPAFKKNYAPSSLQAARLSKPKNNNLKTPIIVTSLLKINSFQFW